MFNPYMDMTDPPTRGAAEGNMVDITTGLNTITGISNVASWPLGKKEKERSPGVARTGTVH
jgi:hypothetical protein